MYVLRCGDGTLYCGITNDLAARVAAHAAGRGARYTRGRGPLEVVAARRCRDKGTALRIEHAVKQLGRPAKLALLADPASLARIARRARSATARNGARRGVRSIAVRGRRLARASRR